MRAWRRRWHLVSPTLYIIIIVRRVNLNKLSRNFVGALRTTTTNCRVSFNDLYLVFPRNFRIVFLPHTNTVILLKPYCGTITEPGSPVVSTSFFQFYSLTQLLLLKACFRYDRYDRCDRWGKKFSDRSDHMETTFQRSQRKRSLRSLRSLESGFIMITMIAELFFFSHRPQRS